MHSKVLACAFNPKGPVSSALLGRLTEDQAALCFFFLPCFFFLAFLAFLDVGALVSF